MGDSSPFGNPPPPGGFWLVGTRETKRKPATCLQVPLCLRNNTRMSGILFLSEVPVLELFTRETTGTYGNHPNNVVHLSETNPYFPLEHHSTKRKRQTGQGDVETHLRGNVGNTRTWFPFQLSQHRHAFPDSRLLPKHPKFGACV